MPYLQRSWLGAQAPAPPANLRTYPMTDQEKDQAEHGEAPQPKANPVDPAKVPLLMDTLKRQMDELEHSTVGAMPISQCPNHLNYVVDKQKVIFNGMHSSIHQCSNSSLGDGQQALVVREFKATSLLKPNDFYLRVLRQLAKQSHASIVSTFDICSDDSGHIFLYQEFASLGNGLDYIKNGKMVSEAQMLLWARGIYQAMDFLGDHGISHRAIQPKHIMLFPKTGGGSNPDDAISAKLSSFRDSALYWDPAKSELIMLPCKPLSTLKHSFFQAPEMFAEDGKQEVFSPLEADVWSYGATMFYFVGRVHPFNIRGYDENIDGEIRNAIAASGEKLSDQAKYWLYGMMRSNTKLRTEFDEIAQDGFFKGEVEADGSNPKVADGSSPKAANAP